MGTQAMRPFQPITYSIIIGGSLLVASSAIAGGFAIREQSTTGLGKAFADSAAGTDLSSMFWNPAAVTTKDGLNTLSSFSGILPDTKIDVTEGVDTAYKDFAVVGASYVNYQINNQLYVGLSINSPFGLVTEASPKTWAGDAYNRKSEILTINAAPTVGYKLTSALSVAVGLQVEYIKARLESRNPVFGLAGGENIVIKGDDVAVGLTAGILMDLTSATKFGIGYRSAVRHKLKGTLRGHPTTPDGDITAKLDTPEIVTASLRHELVPGFAIMANYEWTNWSRLSELRVQKSDGVGADVVELFNWEDSWLVSGGVELDVTPSLTGRAGLGYEKSPVPNETRGARLPDSDRIWLSFGASYKWSETTTLDLGYSHIFFKDSKISLVDRGELFADVTNSADILSVGARMKW